MRRSTTIILSVIVALSVLLSACAPQAASTPTTAVEPAQNPAASTATSVPAADTGNSVPATGAESTTTAPAAGVELPEVNPGDVEGNIITAGSSTVFPLSEAVANLFQDEGYRSQITIDSIGSGAGLQRFCETGETDIANASRAIKDSEVTSCEAIKRNPIAFRIGTDAIAIVVNPQNDFLTNVTMDELALIFSDKAEKWSDVNPAWPAEAIKRYTPGTDSGTYDFFIETVLQPKYDKDAEKAAAAFQSAKNLQQSEDDNVLAQGVEGDPNGIGFFGFAYYKNNEDKLKALTVNDITPDFETAESGEYPLSRPLYLYSDPQVMKEKPQVAAFINFYLTRVNDVVSEVGYFPASDEALNAARQAWLDAIQ